MGCSMILLYILTSLSVIVVSASEIKLQECHSLVDQAVLSSSGDNIVSANISNDEYCIVNNCNIRLLKTGKNLKVTGLFNDYIIATSNDTDEVVTVSRLSPEKICWFNHFFAYGSHIIINILAFLFRLLLLLLIAVASGYILSIHVMFKVLCKLLGKLLIVYNIALLLALFAVMLLIASHLVFAPGSQAMCQMLVHGYSLSFMLYESLGTVVTAQVYYMMYRDYKNMPEISPKWSSQLFEHYLMFAFAPMLPMAILTVGFDFTAKVGNETILPSGHCILPPANIYESMILSYMFIALHKIAQFLVFCYTLYYFCKLYHSFENNQQQDHPHSASKPDINQPGDRGQSVCSSVSESSSNSNADDDSTVSSTPDGDSQEMQEHHFGGKNRSNMSEDEINKENMKYLRRLMISASFPVATFISVILWFLCLGVGPLLKPFSAGGGDVALLAQQATIAAVFLSSKKVFSLCKERLEALTNK